MSSTATRSAVKAKDTRAVKAMQARQAYIESAKVTIKGDRATVKSEHSDKTYTVFLLRSQLIATACLCPDHQERHRVCKHMEAAERKLQAPKTPRRSAANAELVASLQVAEGVKVRKVRGGSLKIVPNDATTMSAECPVDVPEGFFVGPDGSLIPERHGSECKCDTCQEARREREITALEHKLLRGDTLSAEEEALFQDVGNEPIVLADEIKVPESWEERVLNAPLNGNRGFSLLRA